MSNNRRVTRAMAKKEGTAAAYQAVFSTPELVEMILSFLPPKNLFVYQRVSKSFKSTINDSPTLQRLMCLRLSGAPRQTWCLMDPNPGTWAGRTITSVRPSAGMQFDTQHLRLDAMEAMIPLFAVLRTPATLSPALVDHRADELPIDPLEDHLVIDLEGPARHPRASLTTQRSSIMDTYLSDPSCRQAAVYHYIKLIVSPDVEIYLHHGPVMLEVDTGIQLRDIMSTPRQPARVWQDVRTYGDEFFREREWVRKCENDYSETDDTSMDDVLERTRKAYPRRARRITEVHRAVHVILFDVFIPTNTEWETVVLFSEKGPKYI